MATFLYRIGRFSYRRRWLVTGLWVLLLALLGVGAATISGTMSNSFSVPGTEAQRAIDHLAERFPQANASGATARVVFAAPAGQQLTDPANRAAVGDVVRELAQAPKVVSVVDPFQANAVSPDGRYAVAQARYAVQGPALEPADRDALTHTAEVGRAAGLTVEIGGDALQTSPETGITEVIGIVIAAAVLAITFGSLLAAGLPLLTALVGVLVGLAGIAVASGFVDINSNSTILALMLGIAVGIDYALFIVSRFRHEVAVRRDPLEAAGRAVGTAGSAVAFAGLTVIIALAGLSVVGIPVLRSMGLAAAVTVAIAVLVALTLLPALLGFAGGRVTAGRRITSGRRARDPESDLGPAPMGERWARFVTRRRVPVLVLAVLGLALVAVPAADLRLGFPDDGTASAETTQHKAYELLTFGFGPGFNGPLTVVVDAGDGAAGAAAAEATGTIKGLDNVASVSPPVISPDGGTALLSVIPGTGPNDPATTDLVNDIRAHQAELRTATGAQVSVTGSTAVNIDASDRVNDAFLPYLGLVVGLAFLILLLMFRSVLVPLKATLGFLLSVGATFGAMVAVFQWGWLGSVFGVEEASPIAPIVPVLLIGILFGLAMDYQVFLVTRMREDHVHGRSAQEAIVTGFRHGARVVTAAAIIMISVFGGFIFGDQVMIQSIGFALAFGVLVDAFVVRMTIVPAVMSLLDRAAWWLPRWLARILPEVDVEGEKLGRSEPSAATSPVVDPELSAAGTR
ncbi:RND superfamily putative drug exporter [Micromonospora pisi]|uniref:RND superfamily putative drug exporter n=1 Tax=Micromonospora pisi TaxID=589240 RepID=A0A495JPK5_9ACTN|nr:MMPL family transporter [Micromonospora pisi]RKR90565.1 RND superfamily putative drug exporter [Micromonospora pisi]